MRITSVKNGKDAITVLNHDSQIEMVLMDIMMPEMDGYETMHRIRLNPCFKDFPIIALTAMAMKGDPEKCIDAGSYDYIFNPVNTDSLHISLCIWLYQSHAFVMVHK